MSTNTTNPLHSGNQAHSNRPCDEDCSAGTALATQAEQAGTYLADKASEASQYVSNQASQMATSALHQLEDAGTYVGQKADDARHMVGTGIKSMGEQLKSAAPEGMVHETACSLASSLENTGKYIEEHGFSAMGEDLTNVIKRNPLPSVMIAAGIGFLLARAFTSGRSNS